MSNWNMVVFYKAKHLISKTDEELNHYIYDVIEDDETSYIHEFIY
jgi:hypothetical protein